MTSLIVPKLKVAGTGHRPQKLIGTFDDRSPGRKALRFAMRNKIMSELCDRVNVEMGSHELLFITGGALGVDQDLARVAWMNSWQFDVYVPCWDQEKFWPAEAKANYRMMLDLAREWHYVYKGPYNFACMQQRNVEMVDDCDVLLACIIEGTRSGGTYNCVEYAKSQHKEILYVDPLKLKHAA